MNIVFEDNTLQKIASTFAYPKSTNKTVPHRVKFLGEFIVTESGKTLWRTKGHAKLAVFNHFYSNREFNALVNKLFNTDYARNDDIRLVIKELEEQGYLEYVPGVE